MLTQLVFAAFISPAFAADTYRDKCSDIKACAAYVAKVTGQSYTFDGDIKGKLESTGDLTIDAKNAELLFTQMLDANGFTRVPLGQPKTYAIMRQRDAKDQNLPKVTASAKFEPPLPNTWDWYDMVYDVSTPGLATELSKTTRNFMPPNTRVMVLEGANKLIFTASVPVLIRVHGLLKEMDHAPQKK